MRKDLVGQFLEEQMAVDRLIEAYRNVPGSCSWYSRRPGHPLYLPVNLQRTSPPGWGSPSKVSGVVTFYSYFSTNPRGRKVIKVCSGTACYEAIRGGS
ncbi:MAG: NAD(P)H-dependent oxidoreductase subunit E [Syntrophaceae bacterium]|nr:NAD(P)H-dependent oxidoreductase subunit E [Syntrophaceae bacterium]